MNSVGTGKADFKIPISQMAAAVQPSATLAAGAKARQLKAEGIHVFDFSLGEPDFPTPEHICQAAVKAMQDGHTHYTPATGIAELRAPSPAGYQKTYGLQLHRRAGHRLQRRQALAAQRPGGHLSAPATRSSSRRPTGSATATWCR